MHENTPAKAVEGLPDGGASAEARPKPHSEQTNAKPTDAAERPAAKLSKDAVHPTEEAERPDIEAIRQQAFLDGRNSAIEEFLARTAPFAPAVDEKPEPVHSNSFLASLSPGFWDKPDPTRA